MSHKQDRQSQSLADANISLPRRMSDHMIVQCFASRNAKNLECLVSSKATTMEM